MPTLRERLENNLPLFFLATLATGFAAGFGALRAIQEASDSVPVPRAVYEQLRRDADVGKLGRPSAPLPVTSLQEPAGGGSDSTVNDMPASAPKERPLDGAVPLLTSAHCWDYHVKPISIGGKFFNDYAVIDYGCGDGTEITFDIRGWDRFDGTIGMTANDGRSNNVTIKADQDQVDVLNVGYRKPLKVTKIELVGRNTLTFSKSGMYPEVVVGEPRLRRD